MRSLKSSVSFALFKGFCGETSHQTVSSCRRFKASSDTALWPSWAGLNDPPNNPIRCLEIAETEYRLEIMMNVSPSCLALATHLIFERGELLQSHWSACVQFAGCNADFCPKPELSSIGKLG